MGPGGAAPLGAHRGLVPPALQAQISQTNLTESPTDHRMWALLVLAVAFAASETNTTPEEKPVVARGKLLVSKTLQGRGPGLEGD